MVGDSREGGPVEDVQKLDRRLRREQYGDRPCRGITDGPGSVPVAGALDDPLGFQALQAAGRAGSSPAARPAATTGFESRGGHRHLSTHTPAVENGHAGVRPLEPDTLSPSSQSRQQGPSSIGIEPGKLGVVEIRGRGQFGVIGGQVWKPR